MTQFRSVVVGMQVSMITSSAKSGFTQGQTIRQAVGCSAMKPVAARRACAVRVRAEAPVPAGIEKSGPNMKALKEIQEIMDILPHRCDNND